jgi:hypothetical protein
MTRASPRTNFNSSRLIRFLADLSIADAAEPKQEFAERLGQWFDFADAITLHAALNAGVVGSSPVRSGGETAVAAVVGAGTGTPALAVADELARVRAALTASITKSCAPGSEGRIRLPLPKPGVAIGVAADYEPYQRFHVAHQREMEVSIRPLRGKAREALARVSPALRQLATLDAALDRMLGERERRLLATLPAHLERRFGQLFAAHQQRLSESRQPDDPAQWMQPGAWLADFCTELQQALLAELDLRLQAAVGLIEAFSNEAKKHK